MRARRPAALFFAGVLLLTACGGGATGGPTASGVGATAPAGAAETFAPVTITQGSDALAYMAPLFVGLDQGFFQRNNVTIKFVSFPAGSLGPPALLNGDVDVVDTSFSDIANLRNQGKNIIGVYELLNRSTQDLVVSTKVVKDRNLSPAMPLIDRLKALKGLRLGITSPGAPSDVFIRYLVKQGGLNPDTDVQIIRVGSSAAERVAMQSGQIDAFIVSAPFSVQTEREGTGVILVKGPAGEVPGLSDLIYVALAMRSDWVESHPAAVRAYVKSIQEANAWMRDHRDETIKSLQKAFPSVDGQSLAVGYDALLGAISKDGKFDESVVKTTMSFYTQGGIVQTVPSTADGVMWTNKFLTAK